jgi:hypothetical protein
MSWLPWLLLLALVVAAIWYFAEIASHVRWARRALLADGGAPRPQGWLVRKLRLEELFIAIERRAANEDEIRAGAARRIEALLAPLPKTGARVMAAILAHLFDRRLYWAARCAWMAATLKDSDHRCRAEWRNFALVARDLAGTEHLSDTTLFQIIADGTNQAFKANAPRRRPTERKRR